MKKIISRENKTIERFSMVDSTIITEEIKKLRKLSEKIET